MKIEKGNAIVEDTMDKLVDMGKGFTCGCENPQLAMTMHIDGTDFYQYNYVCECGNQISLVVRR